ncbi:cupin domain-containing protein [Rhodococcus tibetensis]|uniref:Cupin domain-containing protein n=1 Tax=Rhodococcus tibetensis TaxID=2965064 RepID=A0ABT1Q6Z1_9NOCA|nr:cupin domain-containing protein [Rhodococcus sp. FXJ9.536]MCQ4118026.1 cupin domain-containing protein [Rhodococcus sp. FXJ9.536]
MTDLPDWARTLDLAPHPEGGWYRETWRSDITVPRANLPADYGGPRSAGTAILFLLLPGQRSQWHSVRSAELWFYHRGSPLRLDLGGDGNEPVAPAALILGHDVAAGHQPQLLVPPRHWQRATPVGDEPTLVSCVVTPGFDFEDFRLV